MNILLIILGIIVVLIVFVVFFSRKANADEGFQLDKINNLTGGFDNAIADIGQGQIDVVPEFGQQNVEGSNERPDTTNDTLTELLNGNLLVSPDSFMALFTKQENNLGQIEKNSGEQGGTTVTTVTDKENKNVADSTSSNNNLPDTDAGIRQRVSTLSGGASGSAKRLFEHGVSTPAHKLVGLKQKSTLFGGAPSAIEQEFNLQQAVYESQSNPINAAVTQKVINRQNAVLKKYGVTSHKQLTSAQRKEFLFG